MPPAAIGVPLTVLKGVAGALVRNYLTARTGHTEKAAFKAVLIWIFIVGPIERNVDGIRTGACILGLCCIHGLTGSGPLADAQSVHNTAIFVISDARFAVR